MLAMTTNEIIVTLGPASSDINTLKRFHELNVSDYRINLSHANLEQLENYIDLTSGLGLNLAIDTQGAQIRTFLYQELPIDLELGEPLYIVNDPCSATNHKSISFMPDQIFPQLRIDDLFRIDFDGPILRVEETNNCFHKLTCLKPGTIISNKGVDCMNRNLSIDALSERDYKALEYLNHTNINTVYISFTSNADVIKQIRTFANKKLKVIAKIENRLGIHSLNSICIEADGILIDRGDLSREISILDLPFAQRGIIKTAQEHQIPCYIATSILESLLHQGLPLRSELNDIVSNLENGAHGIVLAAETAIGKKPILSVEIVAELIHKYNMFKNSLLFADLDRNEITDHDFKIWLNRV